MSEMSGKPDASQGPRPAREGGLLALVDQILVHRPLLALLLPYPLFLAAGFAFTEIGTSTRDSIAHHHHQLWLIGKWRGEDLLCQGAIPGSGERAKPIKYTRPQPTARRW